MNQDKDNKDKAINEASNKSRVDLGLLTLHAMSKALTMMRDELTNMRRPFVGIHGGDPACAFGFDHIVSGLGLLVTLNALEIADIGKRGSLLPVVDEAEGHMPPHVADLVKSARAAGFEVETHGFATREEANAYMAKRQQENPDDEEVIALTPEQAEEIINGGRYPCGHKFHTEDTAKTEDGRIGLVTDRAEGFDELDENYEVKFVDGTTAWVHHSKLTRPTPGEAARAFSN